MVVRLNLLAPVDVLQRGLDIMGFDLNDQARVNETENHKRFNKFFGCQPQVFAALWEALQRTELNEARLLSNKDEDFRKFMITMYYLKNYPLEVELLRFKEE